MWRIQSHSQLLKIEIVLAWITYFGSFVATWHTVLPVLWCCCACNLVHCAAYSVVLLCVPPGALCCLFCGAAVRATCAAYSMVLLCVPPAALCCLFYGAAVRATCRTVMPILWCCDTRTSCVAYGCTIIMSPGIPFFSVAVHV